MTAALSAASTRYNTNDYKSRRPSSITREYAERKYNHSQHLVAADFRTHRNGTVEERCGQRCDPRVRPSFHSALQAPRIPEHPPFPGPELHPPTPPLGRRGANRRRAHAPRRSLHASMPPPRLGDTTRQVRGHRGSRHREKVLACARRCARRGRRAGRPLRPHHALGRLVVSRACGAGARDAALHLCGASTAKCRSTMSPQPSYTRSWRLRVGGAYPTVGACDAGTPRGMRRRIRPASRISIALCTTTTCARPPTWTL